MLSVQEMRRAGGIARFTHEYKHILQLLSILDDCCQEILDRVEAGETLDDVPSSNTLHDFLHEVKSLPSKVLDQPELFQPEYPEDIKKIREKVPEVSRLNDITVEKLWAAYSEDWYCAGWLIVPDDLSDFRRYLNG